MQPASAVTAALPGHARPEHDDRQKALSVARQFEQVFVQMMVANLRQSSQLGGDDGGLFGSGPGSDTFTQWFDDHMSQHLSRTGRIGVSDVLMREFERWHQIPPAPPRPVPLMHAIRNGGIDVAA
jgi:Rod binding domain-containing protein